MKICLFIVLIVVSSSLFAQFNGPIPPISTGYGSDSLDVSVINITNDNFPNADISVFYPLGDTTPNPTIFYSHAYGGNDTTQQTHLLRHIASRGYTVVFVPYATLTWTIAKRYETLHDGFIKAAQTLPYLIDTTRTGFYGHSFGGGATPSIAYKLLVERNWGSNGKFMYCSAPWYTFYLTPTELSNFPTDCNLLTILYDEDDTNDHSMGIDIFENIPIDDSIKDCIKVYADTISSYQYRAGHNLPSQLLQTYDAYDCYVTFRLLDALADYTFNGSLRGKEVALGNGSPSQTYMGGDLKPLTVSDNPQASNPHSFYLFPCDTIINLRQSYCMDYTSNNRITNNELDVRIYPNPTNGIVTITPDFDYKKIEVSMFTISGEKLFKKQGEKTIDISGFANGTYFLWVQFSYYAAFFV